MSVSLKHSYDIEFNGTENVARMDLFIDTDADLTGLTTFDSIKILQGSTAEDISTGNKYAMQTNGTWILQPNSSITINVPDFDSLETRMDSAEGRLDAAEDDISDLDSSDTKQTAALLKLINTGGKNYSPVNTTSGTLRLIIDLNAPAGDYILYIGDLQSTDTDTSVCLITIYDGNGNTLYNGGSTRGTEKQIPINLTATATKIYIYASDNYSHSSGDTVSITNLMLCNKVDWDMTQTYEPYCPTLDQLYALVSDELFGLDALIGGGI